MRAILPSFRLETLWKFALLIVTVVVAAQAQNYSISTLVGVTLSAADSSQGIAVDTAGNVFFTASNSIFKFANGALTRVAGTGIAGVLATAARQVIIATYAPGLFSFNGQGTGPGAIQDVSYRLIGNTNPTTAGADIQIYCTGLGPVANQPATGAPASENVFSPTLETPTVMIGGAPANVLFSGLTPNSVGLYQINAQIPSGIATGASIPVVVTIGGVESNTVTLAVQ